MRYVALSVAALLLAMNLSSGKAWGAGEGDESVHDANYFEAQLAPHGRWLEVADFGRVWQPTVALSDKDWRPYFNNGNWTYTDAGWYWNSSYDWGWAPFHYGRWDYIDNYNWVWTPGDTWAPAWVSWRQSDSHYGWAPLGMNARFENGAFGGGLDVRADLFIFVPAQSFLSLDLASVAVSRRDVENIYKNTKSINNSYSYTNNRVINNGIPVKQVGLATHQEIKAAQISDAKSPGAKGAGGGKISAYRPAIKKSEVPASYETKAKANQPKATELKKAEPKAVEPKKAEQKAAERREAEPKAVEPKKAEPKAAERREAEPKAVEPKKAEPKAAERREAEPKAAEHREAEPKAAQKSHEASKPEESHEKER
jgi:hypothetical protein